MHFFPLDLLGKMSTVPDSRCGLFPSLSAGFELTLQFRSPSYKSDFSVCFEELAGSPKTTLPVAGLYSTRPTCPTRALEHLHHLASQLTQPASQSLAQLAPGSQEELL